jgi:hypothetical protein
MYNDLLARALASLCYVVSCFVSHGADAGREKKEKNFSCSSVLSIPSLPAGEDVFIYSQTLPAGEFENSQD